MEKHLKRLLLSLDKRAELDLRSTIFFTRNAILCRTEGKLTRKASSIFLILFRPGSDLARALVSTAKQTITG